MTPRKNEAAQDDANELGDAAEREAILTDLDVNMVVEAAAGTGKTTSLVGRLMNLFRHGALAGESRLAAVTFTHKAAAELRERLDSELAAALANPDAPEEERANLAAAAAALPECHIGTIHSFCARILRERPVEAGLPPGWRELDSDEDSEFRAAAWREFAERVRDGEHGELVRTFEIFGLDLAALGQGFDSFAEYPDIASWPGGGDMPGREAIASFVAGVKAWHAGLGDLPWQIEDADPGADKLIPIIQILNRRLPVIYDTAELSEAWRLCRLLADVGDGDVKVRHWAKTFNLKQGTARDIGHGYQTFCRDVVEPFRDACLAAAYAAALGAFRAAQDIYDHLRRLGGVANFQDLLLATAAMLRSFPAVRRDLAGRYARLLVDEVQDTDPVQAEIMFLLADDSGKVRDWRRCRPRPGSLFIVGDPKQSIYRFRRADIAVYQEVKRLIAATGGRTLGLSSNFRSQPEIIDWVNRTFLLDPDAASSKTLSPQAAAESGKFPADETAYSPGYVPLRPGRTAVADVLGGVYYLQTLPTKKGESKDLALEDEARRIASFIRDAVDRRLLLPGNDGARPAAPGDFLIVTYKKAAVPRYAAAVRRAGLDCQATGGASLAESPALDLLVPYLAALANPDDPVLLAAALRGGIFGVSDPELYRWRKAGREFSFLAAAPENLPENISAIGNALSRMRGHWKVFQNCEPVLAAERVIDDLGLWPVSCLGDDPATSAGTLATAVELLRSERQALPTLADLLERLARLRETYEPDCLPAREKDGAAVRVMNLHKTKGLEAPVVFLTSTANLHGHAAELALRRGAGKDGAGAEAGMAVMAGEYGNVHLARPAGWAAMAAEEELFLAAERTRLNYVAATRAGTALIVSLHGAAGSRKSAFLPEFVEGETITTALPEPEAANTPATDAGDADGTPTAIDAGALDRLAAHRQAAREKMLAAGNRSERAKPAARGTRPAGTGKADADEAAYPDDAGDAGDAADFGEVLHALLASGADGAAERELAEQLLAEYDLPATRRDEALELTAAARASSVWRRAEAAESRFREAPYTLRLEEAGGTVLQRGVIDLVFREAAGWVIVDYKSDRLPPDADLEEAAAGHAAQLSAYARAWERITGEAAAEAGIYFLRREAYVPVPAALATPATPGAPPAPPVRRKDSD